MRSDVAEPALGYRETDAVLAEGHSLASVTGKISDIPLAPGRSRGLLIFGGIGLVLVGSFVSSVAKLLLEGTGIWGINQPVSWGFDIINFVWWIGIGHAGTLISAILLLCRQEWRSSISRFAESMTIIAVICAGLFPLLHLGRPWLAYWLVPYPNVMQMLPQFQSPLIWDVFAVSTYFIVSLLFWYTGLLPDLATLRDRAKTRMARVAYGITALGWRGSARHWERQQTAYLLLAGLSTPLVVAVHSIVSFDFAVSLVPGWHTTIFPPYFVAGAIFSGFAMVLTFVIPLRAWLGLKDLITLNHLNNMSKIMLAAGLIVLYGYAMEGFFAWYSGSGHEAYMMMNRVSGPYWWSFWVLIVCNGAIPQLLWMRTIRTSPIALFIIAIIINIGMWLERFVIVVVSLHRDYLPSAWGMYRPTLWDWGLFLGTIGLFLFLVTGFIRFLPMISSFEVRELLHNKQRGPRWL